jgi:8-oxo-dGTP pyrophosphatase MutT (NUDIX family)
MTYPPVVVVDEKDQVVGHEMLADAQARGLIYRLVFIIAEDDAGRILLQKRAPTMNTYPNCWDVAAAGHVDGGRSYLRAAELELEEELGISGLPLSEVGYFYFDEPRWGGKPAKRFVKIYKVHFNDLPEKLEAGEVSEVRWFTKGQVKDLQTNHPDQTSEGLKLAYSRNYI